MHRLALTFGMLLALSGAYFPYAWGVGLLTQSDASLSADPSAVAIPVTAVVREPVENERIARQYFPDQAWMLDAKIQLRDGKKLFCYSSRWEQTESKTEVKFEPFALVTFTKDGPLTVLAQSAIVRFQREIDITSPNAGRIVRAQLEGDVVIRGSNNLHVAGRHFIFSAESSRVWSDNPVKFAFDQHHGESDHGIQIDLVIADTNDKNRPLEIEDVKSVHLMRHVVMTLAMPEGDGKIVTPVNIECQGSFRLDRRDAGQSAFAVFDDKVKVRRLTPSGKVDSLDGQNLEVTFVRSADSPANTEQEQTATGRVRFKPTLLVVRGTPANFRSEDQEVHATMGYARYDAVQRVLALSGPDQNPSQLRRIAQQEERPVHLQQANSELECQQVGLKHDEENRIREVVCRGKGWLVNRSSEHEEELSVTWNDQLRRYQDSASPLDVIDISGNVIVKQPQQNARFAASYIKLWMDPLQLATATSKSKPGTQKLPSSQPRRMLAVENVTITSPELHGTTSQLQMWFEDIALKNDSAADESDPKSLGSVSPLNKQRVRRLSGQRNEPAFEDELGQPPAESRREKSPLVIDSKLIRVLVVGRGIDRKPDIGEVWSEGNVTLTQQREEAARPLTIKADQLHLKNQGDEKQVVHLLGQPAKLDDPQMDLQGREIFFDRFRNLVWVDGNGELKLPIDRNFDGQPLAQSTKLSITWNEQMVFDGLMATFTGRVIAGTLDSTMKCQQMEVRMKQRLKFEQGAASADKDPISTIVCRQQVEFDSRVILQSSLNQVRKGRFAAFAMNLKTGRAEAKGPGTLQVWRRGQGKIAGLAPQAVAGSNQATRVKDGGWDFTQIEFADELIGLQEQRSTTCKGQVHVAYGPVAEPLETFDIDRLPKDAFSVSCDSLQITQPQNRIQAGKDLIELVAEGNAWLEGRSFSGQADVISYDSANDLFMLRSLGENDSELTREMRPGGNRVPTIAKTIQFVRSRNVVDVDKVRFSSGLQ